MIKKNSLWFVIIIIKNNFFVQTSVILNNNDLKLKKNIQHLLSVSKEEM